MGVGEFGVHGARVPCHVEVAEYVLRRECVTIQYRFLVVKSVIRMAQVILNLKRARLRLFAPVGSLLFCKQVKVYKNTGCKWKSNYNFLFTFFIIYFCVYLISVDGQWSPWGEFDVCSATCGGGSKQRIRSCTNPSPQYNGLDCEGLNHTKLSKIWNTDFQICNNYICPGNIHGQAGIITLLFACFFL